MNLRMHDADVSVVLEGAFEGANNLSSGRWGRFGDKVDVEVEGRTGVNGCAWGEPLEDGVGDKAIPLWAGDELNILCWSRRTMVEFLPRSDMFL